MCVRLIMDGKCSFHSELFYCLFYSGLLQLLLTTLSTYSCKHLLQYFKIEIYAVFCVHLSVKPVKLWSILKRILYHSSQLPSQKLLPMALRINNATCVNYPQNSLGNWLTTNRAWTQQTANRSILVLRVSRYLAKRRDICELSGVCCTAIS